MPKKALKELVAIKLIIYIFKDLLYFLLNMKEGRLIIVYNIYCCLFSILWYPGKIVITHLNSFSFTFAMEFKRKSQKHYSKIILLFIQ